MKRASLIVVAALALGGSAFADPLEDAVRAQIAGASPGAVQSGPFYRGSGEKTDWFVALEVGKCYWFSGIATGSVEKLAMYLWKPDAGTFTPRLTSERSESGHVVMMHCPKQSGMHRLQAKIEGSGQYIVGIFSKDAPKTEEVAAPTGPNLGAICDKTAGGAAPGAHRQGDFFDCQGNSYGHDDRCDYMVQMDAGKCYWLIACGEPDHLKSISLYLWGPNDKRITEAKSDNINPMVGHCAKETGMYKAQAKITGGSGHLKLGVYVK